MAARPVIALSSCVRTLAAEGLNFHVAAEPYVDAVAEAAEALPLLIPALGRAIDADALLDAVDGVLLTGSLSNVHPRHYGRIDDEPCPPTDERRDATTLPLIRAAVARDVPMLAICRGLQEVNVALGGTLFPRLHEVTGRLDHRTHATLPEEQFAPAHEVMLVPEGQLHRLAGAPRLSVNSLHGQGIDRLAPGLAVEATAADGQIEAVRIIGCDFAIGVQWHPEWSFSFDNFSHDLFAAFGAAARKRSHLRRSKV